MADETGLIAYSNTAAESSLVPFMVSRNIIRLIFSGLGRIQRCVMAFSRREKTVQRSANCWRQILGQIHRLDKD